MSDTYSPEEVDSGSTNSGNPAWESILSVVPEDYHEALTPVLQDWDKGVNDRFQKIHGDYADYKHFKEQGLSGDDIDFALQLAQRVENEPLEIYNALAEYLQTNGLLNSLPDQGVEDNSTEEENTNSLPPEYAQLQEGYNLLADYILQQEQAKEDAEADRLLDIELNDLHEKHGDFDENWVLSRCVNSDGQVSLEEAVEAYKAFEESIIAKHNRPAPTIIGATGQFPGQTPIDPKKLDSKGRIELMANYLLHGKD